MHFKALLLLKEYNSIYLAEIWPRMAYLMDNMAIMSGELAVYNMCLNVFMIYS